MYTATGMTPRAMLKGRSVAPLSSGSARARSRRWWLANSRDEPAPLSLLVVLVPTLLAARLAPICPALAHGACARMVLVVAGFVSHQGPSAWQRVPTLCVVLLLVEDMALIGRIGYVRQLIARRHDARKR